MLEEFHMGSINEMEKKRKSRKMVQIKRQPSLHLNVLVISLIDWFHLTEQNFHPSTESTEICNFTSF